MTKEIYTIGDKIGDTVYDIPRKLAGFTVGNIGRILGGGAAFGVITGPSDTLKDKLVYDAFWGIPDAFRRLVSYPEMAKEFVDKAEYVKENAPSQDDLATLVDDTDEKIGAFGESLPELRDKVEHVQDCGTYVHEAGKGLADGLNNVGPAVEQQVREHLVKDTMDALGGIFSKGPSLTQRIANTTIERVGGVYRTAMENSLDEVNRGYACIQEAAGQVERAYEALPSPEVVRSAVEAVERSRDVLSAVHELVASPLYGVFLDTASNFSHDEWMQTVAAAGIVLVAGSVSNRFASDVIGRRGQPGLIGKLAMKAGVYLHPEFYQERIGDVLQGLHIYDQAEDYFRERFAREDGSPSAPESNPKEEVRKPKRQPKESSGSMDGIDF
jgi:hypothetical protein